MGPEDAVDLVASEAADRGLAVEFQDHAATLRLTGFQERAQGVAVAAPEIEGHAFGRDWRRPLAAAPASARE